MGKAIVSCALTGSIHTPMMSAALPVQDRGAGPGSWLASVTFGGADLSAAYLGGLRAATIQYFISPVAGLPTVH